MSAMVLLMAQPVFAASQGLGFVTSSGIWFSKNVFFDGDTVRVMTVVVNNTYATLTGTLGFFDNETTIAEVSFSLGFEEAKQISANWSPRVGQRTVHARFLTLVGKKTDGTTIQLNPSSSGPALELSTFVDSDTDGDGIGDSQDPDKDNDGLTDVEEIRRGTNVTNPDTDGDGVKDGEEVARGTDPTRPPQPVVEQAQPKQEIAQPAYAPVSAAVKQVVSKSSTAPNVQQPAAHTQGSEGVVLATTTFVATTTLEIASSTTLPDQSVRTGRVPGGGALPMIAYATAALAAVFGALYVRTWSRNRE